MGQKPLVTVIEPEGPMEWFSELDGLGDVRFFTPSGPVSRELTARLIGPSRAVIITSATAIDAELIDKAKNLGIIAKCGGPPSNVDIPAATRRGVAVSCVPGANTTTVAEYAAFLLLGLFRRADSLACALKSGAWRGPDLLGRDMKGALIGVVGYGAIGREVLARLLPFGPQVLVWSPSAQAAGVILPEGARYARSLAELVSRCDAVSVHSRVTPETRNMFNREVFALFKPGAVFVNTARGDLVDEDALAWALTDGPLAAAAVDVFRQEPPDAASPLLSCPNLWATPHAAAWTRQALERECRGAAASVAAFLTGEPIPGLLNPSYQSFADE